MDIKDYENGGSAAKGIFSSALLGGSPGTTSFTVLAHDIQPFTSNGFVQWMIDAAKGQGYQLTTLGECLGNPTANRYRDPVTGGPIGGSPDPPKSSTAPPSSNAPAATSINYITNTTKPEVTPTLGNGQPPPPPPSPRPSCHSVPPSPGPRVRTLHYYSALSLVY